MKEDKISRKGISPSVTEVSTEDFKYTGRGIKPFPHHIFLKREKCSLL
jgi:hypothetical protein